MNILVFQHVHSEHPGIFRDFWNEAGHRWTPIELDAGEPIPPLEPFDLLVVMGGPMDVWEEEAHPWLKPEKEAIRRWTTGLDRPYLGICLGHQLLADALGGSVRPMKTPEVGITGVNLNRSGLKDRALAALGSQIETFQWHGAEVARLPQGGKTLATNENCRIQAMRWGRHAYGIQFHIELTDRTVGDWLEIPEYRASLETVLGKDGAGELDQRVKTRLGAFNAAARQLNESVMTIAAQKPGASARRKAAATYGA